MYFDAGYPLYMALQHKTNRITTLVTEVLRAFSGPVFQPIWPLLAIYTLGHDLWGKAVDSWFFASIAGIILTWGSSQYLQKRFSSFPSKVYDSFVENFYARLPLLGIFLLFLIFSPYTPIISISYVLLFTGRFINQSFEALYVYEKNDWKPIVANLTGMIAGVVYYLYKLPEMSLTYLIFAIGLAEIVKSGIHLILNYNVFLKGRVYQINLEMYLITFNYFMYSFTFILLLTIDRFFVYTTFKPDEKAMYQIFMNFMTFAISIPHYITQYLHQKDRKAKIKIDNNLRMKVMLIGFFVSAGVIIASYIVCIYVFLLPVTPSFLTAGLLFAFPASLYTPILIYFYNKNNHGLLSRCAVGAVFAIVGSCTFFIRNFGLIGGVYAGILGQWIFMFLVTIFYEQDQISKKIKLIK